MKTCIHILPLMITKHMDGKYDNWNPYSCKTRSYLSHTTTIMTADVQDPHLLAWINLISAWISNYMPTKVWYEITYPFPNFNGTTVEVWEWEIILSHTLYIWMWLFVLAGVNPDQCHKFWNDPGVVYTCVGKRGLKCLIRLLTRVWFISNTTPRSLKTTW